MSAHDDGGPAFPTQRLSINGDVVPDEEGMSLRDYFAAKAMQGFAADPDMGHKSATEIALLAYAWADAMLKARSE